MLKLLDVNDDGSITWTEFISETPKIIVDILGKPSDAELEEQATAPIDDIFGELPAKSLGQMMTAVGAHAGDDSLTTNWVVLHMPMAADDVVISDGRDANHNPPRDSSASKPFWYNKLTSEAQWEKPVEVQLLQQVQPDLMDYLSLKFLEADEDLSGSVSKREFCSLIVDIGVGIDEVGTHC